MNLSKWIPWNWFKKEEEQTAAAIPVRRDPLGRDALELDRLFDRFFDRLAGGTAFPGPGSRTDFPFPGFMLKPSLDIEESEGHYKITVEIPGVSKEDVRVFLDGNTLTIRGEKRRETEETGKRYHRVERSYGAFQRILSLPADADGNECLATFKGGVLTLTVPKIAGASPEVRTIEIR